MSGVGAPPAVGRPAGSPRAVAVVFAASGLATAASFARNPSIRDQVSATPQLLSLALVCVGIGSVATMPFTGRLTDRFGSGPVVRAFAVLSLFCWIGVSQAPNIPVLAVAMLFSGAGFGIWDVAMNVQGSLVEQRQQRVLMPMLHALFSFGSVGGALLGALFAKLEISIRWQFPLVWGGCLVAVLWATSRFLDDRHLAAQPTPAGEPAAAKPPRGRITRVEILIGAMMACTALGEGAANDWLAITLVDTRSVPEAFGALALGGFNLTMAIARIVGGRLIARYGRVPVLQISGLTATVGVLLLCLVNSPVTALLGAALWGLGLAVVFPSGVSAAGELGGRGGRSIALVSTVGYGGFLLGAPLIGQLTHFIPLDQALLSVALAAILVVLIAPATRERSRPAATEGGPGEELIRG